jgi:transposase
LRAALTVALSRAADGDLGGVTRLGRRRFDAAVRRHVARWDAVHPWQKIIDTVFAACSDPAGVTEMRHGALERIALLLADRRDTRARLADTEQRMVTVLGELGLTDLVTSITGLSEVGAASILAETGDAGGSLPAARWLSTPASRHGRRTPAATPAGPAPPAKDARRCDWRHGARSGAH